MGAPPKTAAREAMLALAASSPDLTLEAMCAGAGISYMSHRRWCRDDPGYAETFEALREGRLEALESNVLSELARRGTPTMLSALAYPLVLALAGYLAKARNRIARQEVHHSGQVAVEHRYAQMSPEEVRAEVERRAKLLGLGTRCPTGLPAGDRRTRRQ
jgi:hypothetical protein